MCVNIIILVESHHVNFHIRRAQCAEIQCINHQLSICNVLFKVVYVTYYILLSLIYDIIHTVTISQFMKVHVHIVHYRVMFLIPMSVEGV